MAKYVYKCGRGHETILEQKMAEYVKVITCSHAEIEEGFYSPVYCDLPGALVPQPFTFHVN